MINQIREAAKKVILLVDSPLRLLAPPPLLSGQNNLPSPPPLLVDSSAGKNPEVTWEPVCEILKNRP